VRVDVTMRSIASLLVAKKVECIIIEVLEFIRGEFRRTKPKTRYPLEKIDVVRLRIGLYAEGKDLAFEFLD